MDESCSLLPAPWRVCMAAALVAVATSADWAKLPLHLPISLVSLTGSPPDLDTQLRSCLALWPVFSRATSAGSAHGDSWARDCRDMVALRPARGESTHAVAPVGLPSLELVSRMKVVGVLQACAWVV